MTTATMIETVTAEQIGKCYKVIGSDGKAFYQVENEQGKRDASRAMIEYTVKAIFKNGRWYFTCTCPSGKNGFSNIKHASGVCKHVRWSLAAAAEEKAALEEQTTLNAAVEKREHYLEINGKEATTEEYERIMNAPVKPCKAVAPQSVPFSLLKV